jgi:hypothetical protein
MVVLDGQGVPGAVLKTIELTKRRFDEVDEAFAYDQGEGDRFLQYWREAHTRYFRRLGRYAPPKIVFCQSARAPFALHFNSIPASINALLKCPLIRRQRPEKSASSGDVKMACR